MSKENVIEVWKVVSPDMTSLTLDFGEVDLGEDVRVHYKLGEWVMPVVEGSPLFAYGRLGTANDARGDFNGRLFLAQAKPYSGKLPDKLLAFAKDAKSLALFWNEHIVSDSGSIHPFIYPPSNTVLCSSIKLISEI